MKLWRNYDESMMQPMRWHVTMRKSRASLELFWDFKISEYVEYLTRVSSEYIISWVLLSLRNTAGWTSCVFLAYVMPWINKASLRYIAHIDHCGGAGPRETAVWPLNPKFGRYTMLSSSPLWLKRRNLSLSRLRVNLRPYLHDFWCWIDVYTFYWRPFTTRTITLCSYWGYGSSVHLWSAKWSLVLYSNNKSV